jgi:hypothetical protein
MTKLLTAAQSAMLGPGYLASTPAAAITDRIESKNA